MNPYIESIEWGKIKLSSITLKDVILAPDICEEWNWKIDGTTHKEGITIDAVVNLVNKADIFILSTGINNRIKINNKTIQYLIDHNKIVMIMQTEKAVIQYNKLIKSGNLVCALLHSTC
jgi:hypothetical protein